MTIFQLKLNTAHEYSQGNTSNNSIWFDLYEHFIISDEDSCI